MKEEFKNLFDAASAISKQQAAARKEQYRPQGASSNGFSKSDGNGIPGDLEVGFQSALDKYNDLNASLDAIFRINEVDPHSFRHYISQPQNFSQQEWSDIQEGKRHVKAMLQNLEEQVHGPHVDELMPQKGDLETSGLRPNSDESKISEKEQQEKIVQDQKKSAPPKAQKGSALRRRQWLDMH